jgi:glyoxylase-like metal-dependent hydrolase (beta-lactamase superfamily II)
MKTISFFLFFNIILLSCYSLQIKQFESGLKIEKISNNTYIHSYNNSNGIIYQVGNEAIIVSTPPSDSATNELINFVKDSLNAEITAYVIDRWHPDAMEGLDIVHNKGIKSYSYDLTRKIVKDKGLPIPQIGFNPKTEISIGTENVICHFLGEAHTKDGIVVWIPKEKILFGGNEIRNYNGWIGNIADANFDEWSETARNIKKEYGSAIIVVPGHGEYGGVELIDYTIKLYDIDMNITSENNEIVKTPDFNEGEDFIIEADEDSTLDQSRILSNAIVIVQDSTKYVIIKSPEIKYSPEQKRIDSESGRVIIYDKTLEGGKARIDVHYQDLILIKVEDSVGIRVVLKGIGKKLFNGK